MKPNQILIALNFLLISFSLQAQNSKTDSAFKTRTNEQKSILSSAEPIHANEGSLSRSNFNSNILISQGFGISQELFTGLDETTLMGPEKLLIFPNPSADEVILHLNTETNGALTCNLYDKNWKLIKQQAFEVDTKMQEERISLDQLGRGDYFLLAIFKDKKNPTKKTSFNIQIIR